MIDIHTHLGKVMFGEEPLTPSKLIKDMDKYRIDKAVILPLVNPEEEHYYYTTEQALEDCQKYPDRLIPFVNIDPRRGSNDGNFDFYPLLKEYVDRGCKGFGEILANLPTNDKRLKGIYKACGQLQIPVLFDFRSPSSTCGVIEPAGMPYLEEVLKAFPQTIFIGHGPAFWAEIAAGVEKGQPAYPTGKVEKPGKVDYLLEKYPNLYADLSAKSGHNALARDLNNAKIFLEKHHKKLLFGSDYFVKYQIWMPRVIELLGSIDLPFSMKEFIFEKNAQKLLKLVKG